MSARDLRSAKRQKLRAAVEDGDSDNHDELKFNERKTASNATDATRKIASVATKVKVKLDKRVEWKSPISSARSISPRTLPTVATKSTKSDTKVSKLPTKLPAKLKSSAKLSNLPVAILCLVGNFLNARDHCSLGTVSKQMKTILQLPQASPEEICVPNVSDVSEVENAKIGKLRRELKSKMPPLSNDEDVDQMIADNIACRLLKFSCRRLQMPIELAPTHQKLIVKNNRLRELDLIFDYGKFENIEPQPQLQLPLRFSRLTSSWLSQLTQLTSLSIPFDSLPPVLPSSLTKLCISGDDVNYANDSNYADAETRNGQSAQNKLNRLLESGNLHLPLLQTLILPAQEEYANELSQINSAFPALRRLDYGFLNQRLGRRISLVGLNSCQNLEHLSLSYNCSYSGATGADSPTYVTGDYDWDKLALIPRLTSLRVVISSASSAQYTSYKLLKKMPTHTMKKFVDGIRQLTQLTYLEFSLPDESEMSNMSKVIVDLAAEPVTLTKLESLLIDVPNFEFASALSAFDKSLTTLQLPASTRIFPQLSNLHTLHCCWDNVLEQIKFYSKQLRHVVLNNRYNRYNSSDRFSSPSPAYVKKTILALQKVENLVSVTTEDCQLFLGKDKKMDALIKQFRATKPNVEIRSSSSTSN